MSDSAGTPGSGSNSTTSPPPDTKGSDGTTNSTTPGSSNNSTTPEQSKAPPPSSDNNEKGNNNSSSASPPSTNSPPSPPPSNGSSTPASPPPQSSPPPSSPPPSSPPPSSPPPSSPPPSSSSSSSPSPPPPPSSPPPADSQKSPPPSSNSNQPSPSPNPPSPPPPEKSNSSPSDGNDNTESPPTWSPPPPPQSTAASPPPPSTTDVGNQPTPANTTSNALSPPIKSGASTPKRGNTADTSPTKSNSSSSSTSQQATIVGATVAGVFLVAFIAIFFVVRGRRKKRDAYAAHYMPPPNNYSGNSGGYYYSHSSQHPMQHSGPVDPFFGSQGQPLPFDNSYGSQKGYGGGPDSSITSSKTHFSYEEMMEITNGFSSENVIGEGGFGCVYKGQVSDGRIVAIKQLKAGSGQGEREFRAEVEIISRVHHRHLVSLVGYCIHDRHRLLIYEFVPNNTLEHHLHSKGLPVLDWDKRVKIAIGSAKGLAYLHEDCHPKIIHRDIKSANILLDDDFEAQVADFGLARLNDTSQTHVSTRVMGTFGYLAPEYASSGKLTDRSDVFSFGVVLLELITGRKPVDASQPLGDESLVEWARPLLNQALETGDISELVDPRLEKHYVEIEMFRMIEAAAACVRHSAPKRPRMVKVVRALDCDGDMSDLSNGVKYGQSTIYDSGQYNREILKFRRMALGMDESSEFSGDYSSPSAQKSREVSTDFSESETLAINQSRFGRQF